MKDYHIAIVPGDGIGYEVMHEAIKILDLISELNGNVRFKFNHFDYGCEYYLKNGKMMEEDGRN